MTTARWPAVLALRSNSMLLNQEDGAAQEGQEPLVRELYQGFRVERFLLKRIPVQFQALSM